MVSTSRYVRSLCGERTDRETLFLLSNSENHEHLIYFGNIYCVITKHRTYEQTTKPQINYRCCLQFSYLMFDWLLPHKNT